LSAAIVTLCELATAAINAAAQAEEFARPVAAVEDYAVSLAMEATNDWTVYVEPGPASIKPATLDGDVQEEVALRLVMHTRCSKLDTPAIKSLLGVVQLAIDAAVDGMDETYNFTSVLYQSSSTEANQIYDQVRLRDDGVFYSDAVLTFEVMRTPYYAP